VTVLEKGREVLGKEREEEVLPGGRGRLQEVASRGGKYEGNLYCLHNGMGLLHPIEKGKSIS